MSATGAPVSDPAVDSNDVRRFAEVVFGGLSGFVDLRMLGEKGMPEQRPHCDCQPIDDRLTAWLVRSAVRAAEAQLCCAVVPMALDGRGRARAGSLGATAVIVIDLDEGDIAAKRAHLTKHLGAPSLVVASGGVTGSGEAKLHLYWRLADPAFAADLDRVRSARETAARKVGADPSLARVQQPIRLPGSVHCKQGGRRPVRIVADSGEAYDLETLAEAACAMPHIAGEIEPGADGAAVVPALTGPIRAGGIDGITRFDALSSHIGRQIRRARQGEITRAEAWASVTSFNARMIDPSWEEPRLRREFEALELVDRRNHGGTPLKDPDDIDRTEHGLARRLADEHANGWRHVPGLGWLAWTGSHWQPDETNRVVELCRSLCEEAATGQTASDRRRLLSDRTIRAVERLSRCDPRISAAGADWDADGMLLNTPDGVIDLRTGEVSPGDPGLKLTRITRASPGNGCARWMAFLDEITGGEGEIAAYLQRVAGYCLTGRTDEQAFFFLHGPGANGKTVFLEVLAHVLGSYSRTAPLDTFMASRGDRQPIDLAALEGARMAIATETEAGRPWSEARIKAITGGDRIAIRQLYRPYYETTPGYKLLISGNHRPRLTGGGMSMARRLQLVPFDTVIPEERRDTRLRERLVGERDGILGWMLEGCLTWQKSGLRPPRKVHEAGSSYLDGEDFVAQWIAEDCEVGAQLHASSAELFASWRLRAESLGLNPGSARDLGEKLRDLGYRPFRNRSARGWTGLRPRPLESVGARK